MAQIPNIYVPARLELKTTDTVIKNKILRTIKSKINKNIRTLQRGLQQHTQQLLEDALRRSSTYNELQSGQLRFEVGVIDATPTLEAIIHYVRSSVNVQIMPLMDIGGKLKGNIRLMAIPLTGNWSDLLSSGLGTYITEKNVEVNWLDWLLNAGNTIIVRDFEVSFRPGGRTGGAVMKIGSGWRVPFEHAGTTEDNFITRAADSIVPDLTKYIMDTFLKV